MSYNQLRFFVTAQAQEFLKYVEIDFITALIVYILQLNTTQLGIFYIRLTIKKTNFGSTYPKT